MERLVDAYILVHQTGLAYTTISKDNDLFQPTSAFCPIDSIDFSNRRTLRRTFFFEDMLEYDVVKLVQ